MRIAILGGGFGLYGYLPALLQVPNAIVVLPERYKETLKSRNDLHHFYNLVEWAKDEESLLKNSEGIVIALPPLRQYILAKKCLGLKNITHIFLEKPLAPSPMLADDLLKGLVSSKKKFSLGYIFRYTDWGKSIIENKDSIEAICWSFHAHHYKKDIQTWKSRHDEGGGVLRFYGIHLIALLAEIGYSDVLYSEISGMQPQGQERWRAKFIGDNLLPCRITVDIKSKETRFNIRNISGIKYFAQTPFQKTQQQKDTTEDNRVPFLKECLLDLFCEDKIFYDWYKKVNFLWSNVEKI